jgi:hypothetical protein
LRREHLSEIDRKIEDSGISVKSPFDVLSDETLHQFIPVDLQVAPQGFDYQAVDIWKPSCLYLFLGLFGQA